MASLKKGKKQTILRRNYKADDLVFLTNTPAQAESLLHNLEQAVRNINFDANSNKKSEFMCFKQDYAISTLNDKPLISVCHFT